MVVRIGRNWRKGNRVDLIEKPSHACMKYPSTKNIFQKKILLFHYFQFYHFCYILLLFFFKISSLFIDEKAQAVGLRLFLISNVSL